MAQTSHKGNPAHTNGDLPAVGSKAPAFTLTTAGLEDVTLDAYKGKKKIISINPSLDTGVCQATTRTFNQRAASLPDTVVLIVTKDLPFAMKRFCEAEGIKNAIPLSAFRSSFARDYGVELTDTGLKGLAARSIVVLDENDKVVYTELVPAIGQEPDFDKALAAAK
jgi:thiol peroxidase